MRTIIWTVEELNIPEDGQASPISGARPHMESVRGWGSSKQPGLSEYSKMIQEIEGTLNTEEHRPDPTRP